MPQDYSILVIPHIHPGLDKHTARDDSGVRAIIDLTWQITLFIGQISIDLSAAFSPSIAREVSMNRFAEKCLPDLPLLVLTLRGRFKQLTRAKNEYIKAESQRNHENH